jgi:hypothetical protein
MTDTTTMTKGPYSFRAPTPADAGRVAELVDAAYGHYVEQIGTVPGPMTADYSQVLRDARVTIAEREGVVGILTARIPGAELHVVPGAGHLLLMDRAEECAATIAEFLESRAQRSGVD